MKLGDAIRTAREGLKWTQAELAWCTGLSANAIARIERGERYPNRETLDTLLEALNLEIIYLHDGKILGNSEVVEGLREALGEGAK